MRASALAAGSRRSAGWPSTPVMAPRASAGMPGRAWVWPRTARRPAGAAGCCSVAALPPTSWPSTAAPPRQPRPWPPWARVAGCRWAVEESFQATKGLCGLDEHQVRCWRSWHRVDRSALSTTPIESLLTNVSSLVRRRQLSGAGYVTAATIGWVSSTTRRVGLPAGWPTWAGRRRSARPAARCWLVPLDGPANLASLPEPGLVLAGGTRRCGTVAALRSAPSHRSTWLSVLAPRRPGRRRRPPQAPSQLGCPRPRHRPGDAGLGGPCPR
jgi:hypothetical protein